MAAVFWIFERSYNVWLAISGERINFLSLFFIFVSTIIVLKALYAAFVVEQERKKLNKKLKLMNRWLGPEAANKFNEYKEYFKNMTDDQLISAFNSEVGNNGWTNSRALYLAALHNEFENRYDYSDIGNRAELSFAKRIKLIGKKVVIDE